MSRVIMSMKGYGSFSRLRIILSLGYITDNFPSCPVNISIQERMP
jgi:hypothetical protein|nr:hypothetical protein Q903MT_gene721 [Picea sitchensis]